MNNLRLKQLPLALQIIHDGKLSGALLARHPQNEAVLVFKKGQLQHAQLGLTEVELEGDEALYSLLGWDDAELGWDIQITGSPVTIDDQQAQEFLEAVKYLAQQGSFDKVELEEAAARPAQPGPKIERLPDPVVEPGPTPRLAEVATAPTAPALRPLASSLAAAPTPPVQPAPVISTLLKMGVEYRISHRTQSLNSHFANVLEAGRLVAGENWPQVLKAAGLTQFLNQTPPDDDKRTTPVEYLSRINDGFEQVFGPAAPERLHEWGRVGTERSLTLRKSSQREQAVLKLIPGQQRRLGILLNSFTHTMDNVRGEHLHLWKQIDPHQYWLVHFNNLYALGRRRPVNACQVWTASFEAMLRWAGLANDWYVEEIECGCVTGSFDCVFAIRAGRA